MHEASVQDRNGAAILLASTLRVHLHHRNELIRYLITCRLWKLNSAPAGEGNCQQKLTPIPLADLTVLTIALALPDGSRGIEAKRYGLGLLGRS